MKKLVFLTFIFASWSCHSQIAPVLEWEKSFGGSDQEYAYSAVRANDGSFVVAGTSWSNDLDVSGNNGILDYWIVKVSDSGSLIWQRSIGGTQDEEANCIIQTTDGGYIVAGYSDSDDGDVTNHHGTPSYGDFWVVKLNSAGTITWQKSLGGSHDDVAHSVIQSNDGGYVVVGYTRSEDGDLGNGVFNFNSDLDYWVVKLSGTGSLEWQKSYGGTSRDEAYDIVESQDGGYIVVGRAFSTDGDVSSHIGNNTYGDYWVIKIDNMGNIEWDNTYGGTLDDRAKSIVQSYNDGYVIAGMSTSDDVDVSLQQGYGDYWVIEVDSVGNLLWEESYGGSSTDVLVDIEKTDDGGYITSGVTHSSNGDVVGSHGSEDFWVVKLDVNGGMEWQKCLGGLHADRGYSITQADSAEYLVVGCSHGAEGQVSNNYGNYDYWVVKLSPQDFAETFEISAGQILDIYPNPVKSKLYLNLSVASLSKNFEVRSLDGRVILNGLVNSSNEIINVDSFDEGIYFLVVDGANSIPFVKL